MRVAAACGTLAVVAFYLIAQMVGAGNLIRLLFGLSYETAVVIVGAVMLAYVLFGGMIATTWVQIVKAVLLLGGAFMLACSSCSRFGGSPARALRRRGHALRGRRSSPRASSSAIPSDAISLGLALMFGTAGLPHILMRFYTVPDARTARTSVSYATAFIGFFYLLTFVLGFGAMVLVGQDAIRAVDKGGNMAAPLLAEVVGGTGFLGFIAAVAFATILAVVAGLTLSGAAALSHDLWVNVVRHGHAPETEQLRVARGGHRPARRARPSCSGSPSRARTSPTWSAWPSPSRPARTSRRSSSPSSGDRSPPAAPRPACWWDGLGALVLIYLSPTVQVQMLGQARSALPAPQPRARHHPPAFLVGIGVSLLAPARRRPTTPSPRCSTGCTWERTESTDGCRSSSYPPSLSCSAGHGPRLSVAEERM